LPKKTVEIIIKSENDYVIQVKGNQGTLHKVIQEVTHNTCPTAVHLTEEKGHGRLEKRSVTLYKIPKDVKEQLAPWLGLQQFIRVDRSGFRYGLDFSETSYYITSLKTQKAKTIAEGIRGHWGIENRLHWVKDVNMNEDKNGISSNNAPENISIIKNLVINIFRLNGHLSIKNATIAFANKIEELFVLIKKKKART
jgi:predicted transposase YbfD/YdcC